MAIGCSVEFIPDSEENKEQLVVEGMITDQNRVNRIRLSRSLPVGKPLVRKPVRGAVVTITDENGNYHDSDRISGGYIFNRFIIIQGTYRGKLFAHY